MDEVKVLPKEKEGLIKFLNLMLQKHEKYEAWMKFEDFEVKDYLSIPRYRPPEPGETMLSKLDYEAIYRDACRQVLDS